MVYYQVRTEVLPVRASHLTSDEILAIPKFKPFSHVLFEKYLKADYLKAARKERRKQSKSPTSASTTTFFTLGGSQPNLQPSSNALLVPPVQRNAPQHDLLSASLAKKSLHLLSNSQRGRGYYHRLHPAYLSYSWLLLHISYNRPRCN